MKMNDEQSYRVAVLQWIPDDGLSKMLYEELTNLGHQPIYFAYRAPVPSGVQVVFTHMHGPPKRLLPVLQRVAEGSPSNHPITVHWNTEGYPDLRIPPALMWALGSVRSRLGRWHSSRFAWLRSLANSAPLSGIDGQASRFRRVGDYEYACRNGWLDILADSSTIYARLNESRGLPTLYIPWGPTASVYADLGLERDIDVLWMGKRGTRRRSRLLDRVRQELRSYGVEIHIADNEENPFIFDETRTRFLNRAKVTLNLTRTWYDDTFSRFAFAAPNRSLVVSEPVLPHCPEFEAGVHYVSAPACRLAQTIVHYLEHEDERRVIVENAYRLVTTKLAFRNGIARLMDAAAATSSSGGHPPETSDAFTSRVTHAEKGTRDVGQRPRCDQYNRCRDRPQGRKVRRSMNSLPYVVAVILNTDRRDDTLECLASLEAGTYKNHSELVLDNASSDGSVEAVHSAYPAVEIIELAENLGYAGNNNVGIQAALAGGADWVFILNEDTTLAPDCLAHLVGVGQSDPQIGIVGPMVYHHSEPTVIQSAGGIMGRDWQSIHLAGDEPDRGQFPQPHPVDWLSGCAMLVRRGVVEQVGMLDARFFYYWEETEWCLRARKAGWRIMHVPQAKLWHKGVRPDRRPAPLVTYYSTRNHLMMLAKHRAPLGAWIVAWGQIVRTLTSWTVKPRWRSMREHRDAMWRGAADFLQQRWGQMPYK